VTFRAVVSRLLALAVELLTIAVAVGVVVLLVRRIRPSDRPKVWPAHHAPLAPSPAPRNAEPVPAAPAADMRSAGTPLPAGPPADMRPAGGSAPSPPAASATAPSDAPLAEPTARDEGPLRPVRGRGTIGDLLERARLEDDGAA
jgi:hypothetical protein